MRISRGNEGSGAMWCDYVDRGTNCLVVSANLTGVHRRDTAPVPSLRCRCIQEIDLVLGPLWSVESESVIIPVRHPEVTRDLG